MNQTFMYFIDLDYFARGTALQELISDCERLINQGCSRHRGVMTLSRESVTDTSVIAYLFFGFDLNA